MKHGLTGWCRAVRLTLVFLLAGVGKGSGAEADAPPPGGATWLGEVLSVPYEGSSVGSGPCYALLRQDFEPLGVDLSCIGTPLMLGKRRFEHGLGTHAQSHIRVHAPEPIERLTGWIGVDHNDRTRGGRGSVVFSVTADGQERYRSPTLRSGEDPVRIDVETGNVNVIDLRADDAGDGPSCDHADWAEVAIVLASGRAIRLDQMREVIAPGIRSRYPFSFTYGERSSDDLLGNWRREQRTEDAGPQRSMTATTWTDSTTGLRVTWEVLRPADGPAADWLLRFENTGAADTPIIEDVQVLDLALLSPLEGQVPYRLHRTNGGPSNPTDFEARTVAIAPESPQVMGGGGGRSSNRDFPFFKIETGDGSIIAAVGWSGQWRANLTCGDRRALRIEVGMERTRFRLHPGEKVRSPRILLSHWPGDTLESNAGFRQLIYKHYVAPWKGRKPLPVLYCNTCFTRGGGWLNECNAANQISLIRAFGPLGLQALLTDAGWFEGGWPAGAGNWTPRADAYPDGMGPVAAAAKQEGMIYGLWFEPERVVAETWIHRNHPEWLLASRDEPERTYLADFGLPEVRDYFFDIVKGFMDLPGFRVYRQDFNMDPLRYWRHHDPPDRQGISEMRYIEGLYAYWERIAETWPDSLRIECSSGGRRIDLETVRHMHVHQKSDYWFDNEVDQASIWGLSQYLPNNVFMAPLNRMDDYSFHSAMATSLCVGWIADAPDFDAVRGNRLLQQYREVRHLLVGAWYPLLGYSRDSRTWIASQYHRPDLDEGMILVFRRPASPYRTVEVSLRGLAADGLYELTFESTHQRVRRRGSDLRAQFTLTLPERHRSDLVRYHRVDEASR